MVASVYASQQPAFRGGGVSPFSILDRSGAVINDRAGANILSRT